MKDTVNVLKRMMDNHLMGDEYNALKEAIDCVKRVEKLEKAVKKMPLQDAIIVQIENMELPTNCAHCPCLTVTSDGVKCGTPTGKDKRICDDSLYFTNFRPKWCPMKEVKEHGI